MFSIGKFFITDHFYLRMEQRWKNNIGFFSTGQKLPANWLEKGKRCWHVRNFNQFFELFDEQFIVYEYVGTYIRQHVPVVA